MIVGVLKARTGAHEVITTIMSNYIAGLLVLWLLKTSVFQQPGEDNPISKSIDEEAHLPRLFVVPRQSTLELRAHIGFVIAIAAAVACGGCIRKSKLGFELRTFGANADAARYAGMRSAR